MQRKIIEIKYRAIFYTLLQSYFILSVFKEICYSCELIVNRVKIISVKIIIVVAVIEFHSDTSNFLTIHDRETNARLF